MAFFLSEYSKNNSLQIDGARSFINKHGHLLREKFACEEVKILDVGTGCGEAFIQVLIGESGLNFSKAVGIDVNSKMVKQADAHYGSELMSFYVMDIEGCIPSCLETSKFDIVASCYVLNWIKDLRKALTNINRMLEHEGIFFCSLVQSSTVWSIWETLLYGKYHDYYGNRKKNFSPLCFNDDYEAILRRLLCECGFEMIVFEDKLESYVYETKEKYLDSTRAMNPHIRAMPADTQRQFLEDEARMMEIISGDKGSLTHTYKNVYVVAQKKCVVAQENSNKSV